MKRVVILTSLMMAPLVCSPAWSGTVSLYSATFEGSCGESLSQTPVATVTISGPCIFPGSTASATSSELGWSANVSVTGGLGDVAIATASASLSPAAVVLGGTGTGYLRVMYTDEIYCGGAFYGSFLGELEAGGLLLEDRPLDPYQALSMTDAVWSGYIPFTFGEVVALPSMETQLGIFYAESGADAWAVESVSAFDVRGADMNPLPDAYAVPAPEPSGVWLCPAAVVLWRGTQKPPPAARNRVRTLTV